MKVLYINNIFSPSGWGHAGRLHVQALDSVGVEVVCRALNLNEGMGEVPPRILELSQKSFNGPPDVVIQHVLPHMMTYHGPAPNVGFFESECGPFPYWANNLNVLDDVWVACESSKRTAQESMVRAPLYVCPHPCNPEVYQGDYPCLLAVQSWKDQGYFLFYTIGEFGRRKNLAGLLRAYYSEFHRDEKVRLVLKVGVPGTPLQESRQIVTNFISEIQRGLRLYAREELYSPVMVICERLTENEIYSLHTSCDCFVSASYGESTQLPARDAMFFGKTPIVPDSTGFLDYMSFSEGWLVQTYEDAVFGVLEAPEGMHTGRETWRAVSIPHLRSNMRDAFTSSRIRSLKSQAGKKRAEHYSFTKVGEMMKRRLRKVINHELSDERKKKQVEGILWQWEGKGRGSSHPLVERA